MQTINNSSRHRAQTKISTFLKKCRKISLEWKEIVENAIEVYEKEFKRKEANEMNENIDICCSGVLTYFFDKINFEYLLNSTEDVADWLNLVSIVSEFSHFFNDKKIKQFRTNTNIIVNNTIEKFKICDILS